jgi:hypothetical protein
MAITPDFKAAAYNINCVLNGTQHQWCDGQPVDVQDFKRDIDALRASGLVPYLNTVNAPLARALNDAFDAVDRKKDTATKIFTDALTRVVAEVPQIAEHSVDFGAYCSTLSRNKGRIYAGQKILDPNLRAA